MSETKLSTSLTNKHILVTGGTGYIGSHTVIELINKGAKVTIVDSLINSNKSILDKIKELVGKTIADSKDSKMINGEISDSKELIEQKVIFECIDLCNASALDELFAKQKINDTPFDAVIHLAGFKSVLESTNKPLLYYTNNLVSTINLLNCMSKYNCTNLIFSSSATVYGQLNNVSTGNLDNASTGNLNKGDLDFKSSSSSTGSTVSNSNRSVSLSIAINNPNSTLSIDKSGSSDLVPLSNKSLKETQPVNAINPYGQTKIQIEQILSDISRSESGVSEVADPVKSASNIVSEHSSRPRWNIIILRYFNPIGCHPVLGEDISGAPSNLLPYIMQVAIGKLPHLNIYGNDYDSTRIEVLHDGNYDSEISDKDLNVSVSDKDLKSGEIKDRDINVSASTSDRDINVSTSDKDLKSGYKKDKHEIKDECKSYSNNDRTAVRDYVHVLDIAHGHIAALNYINLEHKIKKQRGIFEILNLGTGHGTSVMELLNICQRVSGRKIPYKIVDRRPGDVAVSFADVSKADRVLNWRAKYSVEQAVEDAWKWYSKV